MLYGPCAARNAVVDVVVRRVDRPYVVRTKKLGSVGNL